jgi:uncharacterized protein YbjT (DUF2867 family)
MPNAGKVLVTGATGNTGPGLVTSLCRAGVDVRILVRNATKAKALQDAGAEVVVGDLDKPATIPPAVEGVSKIYLLTWNGPTAVQQAQNVIEAARHAGIIHLVRHSMWGSEQSRIIQQGYQIEQKVKGSGLPWTLLKPTFFMQNTMMAAQTISSNGMIYWDMKDGKLGMIDVRDIADAAFSVLTGSGHEGKSYILTGPAAISFYDVAKSFSNALGKDVKYVSVPGEAAVKSMIDIGLPKWIAEGYLELDEGFADNFANSVTENVPNLTGHPARSFDQFAHDFAQIFGGRGSDQSKKMERAA